MKKWLRNLLKGVSLTAALFVFQACYGTPVAMPETVDENTELVEESEGEDVAEPVQGVSQQ